MSNVNIPAHSVKSIGHLDFVGDYEYFERDGAVYMALIDNCIMTDGFRCGRFECQMWAWERHHDRLVETFRPTPAEPFSLAYSPLPDPIQALPLSVRPIARFLANPVWTWDVMARIDAITGRAMALVEIAHADDRITDEVLEQVSELIDEAEAMISDYRKVGDRMGKAFSYAEANHVPTPVAFTSKPIPVKPVVRLVKRDAAYLLEGACYAYVARGESAIVEHWDGLNEADRKAVGRHLISLGWPKLTRTYKAFDRFSEFVRQCQPARDAVAAQGCPIASPQESYPVAWRANAVYTPEPTPTGDIPRSVNRVELLDSRGYSQGDTYRRSAPGCWRHERLGCEMYVEMMNAYCHSGIVVFLPDPEPTDPPTDYGHKGLGDDSRAVDAAPVPDWLQAPTPNPFDEVEFAPEWPAPICGGSPEAEPTPGEPIDHDTMLKLWLDSKATLVIDGISHRVFCYGGHGYPYHVMPDGTGIPDGLPTCTILCEVDHPPAPLPPLSGGSPELDAPPVPVFPDEDYDNGDRPDDDHDTPSSWDGIPEPIDPDATCLDIPITPDDDHQADEWALYDACESMIVAGSRRSRLAHVEDALRTILLHILETEVRIGQAARVTWKHRMSAERREDFLEWIGSNGILVDPNGDAPTDPAEMWEWMVRESRDGCLVDFPEPTPTPDPDGDDDEATRSTLVLPDTAMACGDLHAQRSTPIGALTHDSVASLDEVRLPVPAGLHAGHAGQDHRAEESGPDRDGERPLPAPGGPGHRGPVPRLEAPAPAAGDVEAPDTLTWSSETSSNPFPAFLGGDDDDEAIGPGRRAGSGDQEPPTHGARHGVPAEPGPCRAAGPMDCGPRGDQGRPAGRHRPRSLRAPGPAGHDNASLTPDTLTIQGRLYGLATAPDGWDVCRTDGVSYRVTTGPLGLECDCPSFRFACQGIHGAACKHCVAIREAGLIPQAQPAPPLPGPGPEFFRNPCPAYIDAAAL